MTNVFGLRSLVVGQTSGWRGNIEVSNRTRWIAVATGCVTALAGIPAISLLSLVLSGFLIIGAALAGRFPRYGRDLTWFGAGISSAWGIPLGLYVLYLSHLPGSDLRVIPAVAIPLILLICCDVFLTKDAFSQRPTTND
jgi:hypothetical protein